MMSRYPSSNHDIVLDTVRAADGVIPQLELVETLGWSKSKTSQVSTDMENAGLLKKHRIGRRNIVMLPDQSVFLDPFTIMANNGFDEYVSAAKTVLPDDWEDRYPHSPMKVAAGLTYYVAYDDYTQNEIASAYDHLHTASVRQGYQTLRNDLGLPQNHF